MDSKLRKALDAQDWQTIMVKLYAHSVFRLNWFGIKSEARLQGKDYKDFAQDAVTLVYEGKRNWDPVKYPDIIKYLKQVINSLISNLLKSDEKKRTIDADLTEEINDVMLFDDMFEKKMINQDIIEQIEDTLMDEPDMWIVFTDLAKGLTPLDICEKYENMEIEKIRNIQKRLKRHIRNIKNL